MQWKITMYTKHVHFSIVLYCTENMNSIHILFIIDTSTNYVQIVSVTEYRHGWLKCLNIHCASEAQSFERQAVHMAETK